MKNIIVDTDMDDFIDGYMTGSISRDIMWSTMSSNHYLKPEPRTDYGSRSHSRRDDDDSWSFGSSSSSSSSDFGSFGDFGGGSSGGDFSSFGDF